LIDVDRIGLESAVFNAVADALALVGASIDRTPLTPDTILGAIDSGS
jgi:CO/xanthine dehydrogenase Mo-binding subunit